MDVHGTIRVRRGNPSPEELAVLTAVLLASAAAGRAEPGDHVPHGAGAARWRRPERERHRPEPGSWRGRIEVAA